MATSLLVAAAAWPVWPWYAARISDGSDEPWCVLALLTAAVFLARGNPRGIQGQNHPMLGAALLVPYILAVLALPPIFRAATAFIAVGSLLAHWRLGPGPHWGFYGLLLLGTPLTSSFDFYFGFPLRWLVSHAAAFLLGLAGITASAEGTLLRWGASVIEVDAPCGGVRMLFAGLYLSATLAALYKLNLRASLAAAAGSLGAIVAANIFRATALFFPESGILPMPGWTHGAIGLVLFAALSVTLAWWCAALHRSPLARGRLG